MAEFYLKEETYKIIGVAMEVHRELDCGFFEAVYQEVLAIELNKKKIPFYREQKLPIYYKGKKLKKFYIADFICFENIIVELKALSRLASEHEAQLLNYLKATELQVGLLIKFGRQSLEYKRMVM